MVSGRGSTGPHGRGLPRVSCSCSRPPAAMAPRPGCPLRCWLWGALCGLIAAASPITARFGGDVTLSCFFPSRPGLDLQRLTLTWQKERAGAEALVVHSYYYGRDQLARQAEAYRNRTWLDPEGLAQGNAALRLRGVRLQDEGVYLCHVTSELGQTSEHSELRMEAPYGEPHLTFDLSFRLGHALLTFSSGGGYPRASVEWREGTGTNLTELSGTTESVDARGLYNLCSKLAVPVGQSTNLTVLLVTAGRETPVQLITLIDRPEQRCSRVWLLVACLGVGILSVIVAMKFISPPGRGTGRRCSAGRFTEMADMEDPSPQSQPGPGACPAPAHLTTGLASDLLAAPSSACQGSGDESRASLDLMVALYNKDGAVPGPTRQRHHRSISRSRSLPSATGELLARWRVTWDNTTGPIYNGPTWGK